MSCDTSMSGNTGVLDSVNFRAAGSRTGQDTARIGYGAPSGLGYQPSTALETWEVGLGQQLAGWQLQQQNHQNTNQGFLQQQNSNLHGNSTAEQWSQADTPYVYSSGGNMDNSFTAGNPRGRRGSIIFSRDDIQVCARVRLDVSLFFLFQNGRGKSSITAQNSRILVSQN